MHGNGRSRHLYHPLITGPAKKFYPNVLEHELESLLILPLLNKYNVT